MERTRSGTKRRTYKAYYWLLILTAALGRITYSGHIKGQIVAYKTVVGDLQTLLDESEDEE